MGIDSILNWFKLAPEDEDYDDDFAPAIIAIIL